MVFRYRNIFRFRYVFAVLFTVASILFVYQYLFHLKNSGSHLIFLFSEIHEKSLVQNLTPLEYMIIDLTLFSFFIVFLFVLFSIWYDYKTSKEKILQARTRAQIIPIIINCVYSDLLFLRKIKGEDMILLKKLVSQKRTLEVYYRTIIHLQELVDDDLSKRLLELSEEIGADKKIDYFLHSIKDIDVLLGLKAVKTLQDPAYLTLVNKYLNNNNRKIRLESVLCLMSIPENKYPASILDYLHDLSISEINQIFNTFKINKPDDEMVSYWLKSIESRNCVPAFMYLKEIRNKTYKNQAMEFIKSHDFYIRTIAWDYFTSVAEKIDLWPMFVIYKNATNQKKMLSLEVLRNFEPDEMWRHFLEYVIKNDEPHLKVIALDILMKNDPERFMKYMNTRDENIQRAYREVINIFN